MQLLANMVAWNNGSRRLRAMQTCHECECDEINPPNKAQRDIHDLKQKTVANKNHKPPSASKEYVLNIAFFSFVAFCILETVFAILANSKSMMADAQAMSIDALTYLFNLAAEHVKNQPLSKAALLLSPQEQARRLELRKLYLELVPPAISVVVLIIITAMTFLEAFNTLQGNNNSSAAAQAGGGDNGEQQEEEDVSIQLMLGFSAANLLLDILNVMCFARANSTYGLDVVVGRSKGTAKGIGVGPSLQDFDFRTIMSEEGSRLLTSDDKQDQPSETATGSTTPSSSARSSEYGAFHNASSSDLDNDKDDCASISSTDSSTRSSEMVNLNMCSAWTHVCADTLRSTAVLIAAFIATLFPSIPGETADAAAAIAVSIIIFFSVIPLIQGLVLTAIAIQYLHRNPLSMLDKESTSSTTTTSIRSCHECSC